jgi:hypothetical protein
VTSSVRRGLCLRKLCARLRTRAPPPAPLASLAPACAHCRLPAARCVCRDLNQKVSISARPFHICSLLDVHSKLKITKVASGDSIQGLKNLFSFMRLLRNRLPFKKSCSMLNSILISRNKFKE